MKDRYTDRYMDRQVRQTERPLRCRGIYSYDDSQKERETFIEHIHRVTEKKKQTDRHTDRHTVRQTDRHIHTHREAK